MKPLEGAFLWGSIALYVATFVASMLSSLFRSPRARTAVAWCWPAALGLHLAAGLTRWTATGHAPVMYAYENSLSGSFFVGLIFFFVARRWAQALRALPVAVAAVLLILGNGLMSPARLSPLEPPFRSAWLVVHVLFAWVAFGSFLVASVIAGLYLRGERRARLEGSAAPAILDDICGRLITLGFAGDTVMIASGAIWAHGLWGRYWAWDPVETWSFITWLIYGVNIHLRFTLGWKGRKAALLALFSVITVVVTFFGIGVVSEVHTQLLR
ncbi:MAG TPA: cytochrome c biogenesis protein CcsA [Thermoanaerobaculia bacterium]|nr:cytochrome c biogenesis protein CcsA [Thermoanaerobaculia bacterium]